MGFGIQCTLHCGVGMIRYRWMDIFSMVVSLICQQTRRKGADFFVSPR